MKNNDELEFKLKEELWIGRKPCPFCGEDKPNMWFFEGQYRITCPKCFCILNRCSKSELVQAWNSRPPAEREKTQ